MHHHPLRRHVVLALLAASVLVGGCAPFSPSASTAGSPPTELAAAHVAFGSGFVTRRLFASHSLGKVTDFLVDPTHRGLRVAGSSGAGVFAFDGRAGKTIGFGGEHQRVAIVPIGRRGNVEYLTNDSWSAPPTLISETGDTIWTAPNGSAVDDSCAIDLNGTGKPQIVVAYNGGGGVSLFNGGDDPIWNVSDANCWHVSAYRDDKTRAWRIVHSNAGGQLVVRNLSGVAISHTSGSGTYMNDFNLCRWPTRTSPVVVLYNAGDHFAIAKLNGTVLQKLSAPDSSKLSAVHGCFVRLKASQPDYFAVLASEEFAQLDRSTLSIYASNGKLVYEEVLPETCKSLAVLPATSKSQSETLLAGGDGHIWRY